MASKGPSKNYVSFFENSWGGGGRGVSKIFGFLIFLAKKDTEGYGKFFPFQWPIKA